MDVIRQGRRAFLVGLIGALCGCAPGVDPKIASAPETPAVKEEVKAEVAKPVVKVPDSLKQRIELAVEHVRRRDLRTNHAFWTVFHGVLTFGEGLTLLDEQSETRVPALEYMLSGNFELGQVRGMVFIPTKHGLDVQMGPTYVGQGHPDQFLAILAQWDIPIDRKVYVYQHEYTVRDFVTQAQANAKLDQELSWTIIALGKYLGTDIEWTNAAGEKLHYDDLIRVELNASVNDAACGGTHRLGGLTWAYHQHLSRGGKETEVWKQVADKIAEYQAIIRKYQNPDGTFSTNYFRGPGADPDVQLRLGSTGHQFEWLAASLSDEELRADWMLNAAHALAMMFLDIQSSPVESGALYHATHGLVVYYERLFGWANVNDRPKLTSTRANEAQK